MGQIISEQEYFDQRSERIGASALERTGLYEANLRQLPQLHGIYAVKDTVQIAEILYDGTDFRVSMVSHQTDSVIFGRITLNGIMYQDGAPEKGYLVAPPMDDLDHELEALCGEFLEAIPLYTPAPPQKHTKHLEAPLQ